MRSRIRADAALGALLAGALLHASCGRNSETVTGPRAAGAQAEGTPVPRMPIIRVQRQTPTRTPTGAPSGIPTATPTSPVFPTSPPAGSPTPAATPTPTPTRTSSATITVRLRVVSWAWQFVSGTDAYGYPADGSANFTLKQGQKYELRVYNGGIPDPPFSVHIFSGNAGLGVSGATIDFGPDFVQSFTAPAAGTYAFLCNESNCGRGHDSMTGTFTVVP